ncbi:olfactory receptor 2B6-like [Bombina bombina]|uniref:olfactory receptor 2B6-like n=1 Tax=Bombina bombina TaxID=8345 RepID=UPI00235B2DCA|nr:olfactory receptor 2B6-like [Bombina bombina]
MGIGPTELEVWGEKFENTTLVEGFILLGLVTRPSLEKLLFVILAATYIMTIIGNFLIIGIIRIDSRLHTPMYFFLLHLALIETLYTTTVTPNTLKNLLHEDKRISFAGCLIQMFLFISLGGSECVLLGTMAYDRYVAICHPLLYPTIMNQSFCLQLALTCWAIGLLNSLMHTILTSRLPFCNDFHIQHYFCEIPAILKLSCQDIFLNELLVFIFGGCITVSSLTLTLVSYASVVTTVLRIPGKTMKYKTFSTCSSHLIVVSIFFGTVISIYLFPVSQSSTDHDRVISIVYGVLTPLFNPIIYSFRNKEFQKAMKKLLNMRVA